jgi:WD40 repeat protein
MGKLIGVPSLPPHFLGREDRLRALRDAVTADLSRPIVVTGASARAGVHGMGGIGKSVLATALARDSQVRRAFPDGVVWLTFGRQPDVMQLQRDLARAIGYEGYFENVSQGRNGLSEVLVERAVLLLLDDVRDREPAEAFDVLGPRCRAVITTRNASLITALGGSQHQVQLLGDEEALKLLAEWSERPLAQLPEEAHEVMRRCGRLPLALAISGAMVRDGTPWCHLAQALRDADLEFLEHPHGSVLKSIKVSVDSLPAEWTKRFSELAVFPSDETIPEAAVHVLWGRTGNLIRRHAAQLLTQLERRSLVRLDLEPSRTGQEPKRRVSLHDLLYDYARILAGDSAALHNSMLEAYGALCPRGWPTGPDDGYFFQGLPRHLSEAGRTGELRSLFFDCSWLVAKLAATDVNALIADGDRLGRGHAVDLLNRALRLSAHILARDKAVLRQQICGRLPVEPDADLARTRASAVAVRGVWLRLLTPTLARAGGPLTRTLQGHSDRVNCVAVSADGRLACSGSDDRTVRVWDLETGELLRTLEGHAWKVNAVAMSADGRLVCSASEDRTVKLWDLETGELLRTLQGHTESVRAVAMSGDGRRAFSASWDRTIRVWNLEKCKLLRTVEEQTWPVNAVAVSADGQRVCSGSWDGTVKAWNVETGQVVATLGGHTDWVDAVAVSADGRRACSASGDGTVRVWNLDTGNLEHTLKGHTDQVASVAVSADGQVICSASYDRTVKVWDSQSGDLLRTLEGHTGEVVATTVSADGRRVCSASYDRTVKVWDLRTVDSVGNLEGHCEEVVGVAASSDGRRACSGSRDRTVKVWDIRTGRLIRTLCGHTDWVKAVAVSADGRIACSGSDDGTVRVWDVENGELLRTLVGHAWGVRAVALSADGRSGCSGSEDRTVKIWNLETGKLMRTLQGHTDFVNTVAVSADARYVCSGSNDGTVRLWNLETDEPICTLVADTQRVYSVTMTADAKLACSGSRAGTIRLWDLGTGQLVHTLAGHTEGVNALAISADGGLACSGSWDGTVKVWNLESGQPIGVFYADARVPACAATPDLLTIVAGDASGRVHFLRLEGMEGLLSGPPGLNGLGDKP